MTVHRFGNGARKVLALHCSLAHGGVWGGLDLPGCAVIAPDLPGHGARPLWDGDGDYNSECTRAALALMDAPMDVIGHSSGAIVALRMALERPELVRSLVLFEPVLFAAARAADDPAFADYMRDFAPFGQALAVGDIPAATAFFHGFWGGAGYADLPRGQREYMENRINLIPAQMATMEQDTAGLLGYMRLESLGIPVLLMEGARSHPVMAAIQSALAQRLPQVARVVVEGAGHMAPITHRGQVSAAIADFYGTSSMM